MSCGVLQPGDCVILNAANSTVGQLVVQLCRLLQLRCVAVVRRHDDDGFDKVAAWLKGLGASEVIADQMSVKVAACKTIPHRHAMRGVAMESSQWISKEHEMGGLHDPDFFS